MPDSIIQSLLVTATYAPSAHNRQPWRFVVVRDPSVRAQLAGDMARDFERDLRQDGVSVETIQAQVKRARDRLVSAPAAILLCLDMAEMDSYPDPKRQLAERTMAIQSVAAAGLQLLLAAHAGGLGGVWVCSPLFAQQTIQTSLNLPPAWEPQGMFFIGYPDGTSGVRERKDIERLSLFL